LRPTLAYGRGALTATVLNPLTAPRDSAGFNRLYALAPELAPLLPIFDAGNDDFDNHDGLLSIHRGLFKNVADALSSFYNATVELGIADKVTAFTASDSGRTLSSNNDGFDQGWGSMHFMLGGAVNGRRFYGTAPAVANNGPDDVGQGRLFPTTSVDQYAATLGKWMGASDADLLSLLPDLHNFNAGSRTLGFL